MLKYFIEDSEGRWLTNPEEAGESWTRDPFKAWMFDRRELSQEELMKQLNRKIKMKLWFDKDVPDTINTTADDVLRWYKEEGVLEEVHVTEQEFVKIPGEEGPGSTYHLSSTHEEQFTEFFMTGESIVKLTPDE